MQGTSNFNPTFTLQSSEISFGPCQTSMIEPFAKLVNGYGKSSIKDV